MRTILKNLPVDLRHAIAVLLTCPFLLMAVLCSPEEDFPSVLEFDDIARVSISQGPVFTTSDTLWITGRYSALAYDTDLRDSVPFPEEFVVDNFTIARLKSASVQGSNAEEAVDDFKLEVRNGEVGFVQACPTASVLTFAPRTSDGESYRYELGLVPRVPGDYVLSWNRPVRIQNAGVNIGILQDYPWNGNGDYLGITSCGSTSARLDVEAMKMDYFFTVE